MTMIKIVDFKSAQNWTILPSKWSGDWNRIYCVIWCQFLCSGLFTPCYWEKIQRLRKYRVILNWIVSPIYQQFLTKIFFTKTAEIHARSLANFYCQYADRHMNLKFMWRISEREAAIRQFVIIKKLMSVFNASVLLLIMNFVITLSK